MILNNEEMLSVEGGGGIATGIAIAVIGGAVTFLIGLVDGIIHPKKC